MLDPADARQQPDGVRLVQVNWPRMPGDTASNSPLWDTHANNEERLRTALMPPMDLAYSAADLVLARAAIRFHAISLQ